MNEKFLKQLGTGVASLTFGVALAIFIYAFPAVVTNTQALLLYITSFLLMLRLWWRYTELFIQFLPSRNFWNFLLDFIISFLGIIAVLYVNNIQTWALIGLGAMIASILRTVMSWKYAKGSVRSELKRTIAGALVMAVVFIAAYLLVPIINAVTLSLSLLAVTLVFVILASCKFR